MSSGFQQTDIFIILLLYYLAVALHFVLFFETTYIRKSNVTRKSSVKKQKLYPFTDIIYLNLNFLLAHGVILHSTFIHVGL